MNIRIEIIKHARRDGCIKVGFWTIGQEFPPDRYALNAWNHGALKTWCKQNHLEFFVDRINDEIHFSPMGISCSVMV